jgi:cysteine desulfurase
VIEAATVSGNRYFDNCATTMVLPEVVEQMLLALLEYYGNPSSPHGRGFAAEKMLGQARHHVAKTLQVRDEQIVFTSGGTESDNLGVLGSSKKARLDKRKAIVSCTEHAAVLASARELERGGWQLIWLPVDASGCVDLDVLHDHLDESVSIVSIMHANNETGIIADIAKIGQLIKERSEALFHVDAVQSWGKSSLASLIPWVDFMSFSAHKIHGPKGVGALFIKDMKTISPLLFGGGQESGIRPGTENLPGIVGMAEAATRAHVSMDKFQQKTMEMAQLFMREIEAADVDYRLNSNLFATDKGMPHIVNISFPGYGGEVVVNALSERGFYVGTGAACSSRRHQASHVLQAMGLNKQEIDGALRISFSLQNTLIDVAELAAQLGDTLLQLAKFKRR